MEIKRITSSELPKIDISVRECVNQGRWTLFRTYQESEDDVIQYYIKGNKSLYKLDNQGHVVSIGLVKDAPPMDEIIYFSDVASPPCLSERKLFEKYSMNF
jgi:hypothetical protein